MGTLEGILILSIPLSVALVVVLIDWWLNRPIKMAELEDYAEDMRCETCQHCITLPQACYCDKHIICTKPAGFCDFWVSLDGKHEWLADFRCTPSWKRSRGIDLAAEYSKYKRAIIEEELFMKGFMDEGR